MASAGAAALRRRLEQMEGVGAHLRGDAARAPDVVGLGLPELDACFRHGGLEPGVHHAAGQGAAALGFATALTARLMAAKPRARALIIQEADAVREHGALYAPGLKAMGVDPGRVLLVQPKNADEALRIADDALRTQAFKAVILELRKGEGALDLSLTRRFNMAASERSGALVFLVTPTLESTSAALTRWQVGVDPARAATAQARRLLGRPTFAVTLTRNRFGPAPLALTLEWDVHERSFRVPAPISAAVAAPPDLRDRAPALSGDRFPAAAGGRRQTG